jgi:hypothetical protein
MILPPSKIIFSKGKWGKSHYQFKFNSIIISEQLTVSTYTFFRSTIDSLKITIYTVFMFNNLLFL